MNERIKLLAKQAGLKIEYQMVNPPKPLQILGSAEQFEKFADSLIQESINIVAAGGEFASRPKLVEKLQEHFGVEE